MLTEALFSAIAEAVFGYLLQEAGLADRVRAVLGADPERRAFQTALARACAAFARQYPDLAASLFDETFLTTEGAPVLAQLLTRRGRPDPADLARRWAAHLGHDNPDAWPRLAEATRAAADFLTWLEAELAQQPALQPLWDSRALERIAENTEAIRQALEANWRKALDEASRYVQVAGDVDRSIIVTGDRNTVTQVFQTFLAGDYTPLTDLYLPPDAVFERVRLDDFAGRAWLEADLDRFLSEHERGVWVLVGEAGVGKTTFLAHLVRERRYLHFFAEQAPGEAGVTRALQSLAAQLVARYRLEPYADRDALSPSQAAYPDFLERLLRMAAERLAAGERLVIVVDALDEAGVGPNRNVLGLPKVLPKGVYLILSQRPVNVPLHVDPYPVCVDLRAGDARNLADVEAYLRGVARRPAIAGQLRARGYAEDHFVQALREKSAGNWMYLAYVVREIEENRRHPLDLARLPVGLAGYYAEYWGRWRARPEWDRLYAPLAATLAAAREMVTPEMLARWAGLEADHRLRRLLQEEWAPFLFRSDDRFRLYHASLRDFLSGAMPVEGLTPADRALVVEMAERTREAHRRIADYYIEFAGGDWGRLAGVDGGYGLRHLAEHLAGAGEWERLHRLVAEGGDQQPWAEARHAAEGNYTGYLADLDLAWRRAEEEGRGEPAALGRQVRCALIESSIHSLAGNIPPELLAAALEKGVLGPPAALAYARQASDPWQRAHALAGLAPHLPEELLREALAAAWKIGDASDRAEDLAGLAPHLPPELRSEALQEALAAAREIGWEYARAEALAGLAPHLPPELLQEALAAAREIEWEDARAEVLAGLAPHLPPELLWEALAAAWKIRDASDCAEVLAGLAPRWAEWAGRERETAYALWPETLRALAARERETAYALWPETLRALAARPRPDLLSDLRALSPVLAALGGEAAAGEAFRAIQDVGRWWP
ncbi:MAG: AAA family ATPase [Thermoflexales bacterium]|nr:AAA family ATPase [Thermoflexales bacterium]